MISYDTLVHIATEKGKADELEAAYQMLKSLSETFEIAPEVLGDIITTEIREMSEDKFYAEFEW